MRLPRVRVRTMILAVAVVAIAMGIARQESKRRRLRYLVGMVAKYQERENYWADQEIAMRRMELKELADGRPSFAAVPAAQALYDLDRARYFGSLRRKYEQALRHPDNPVEIDPPPPPLYPRDYLPKVPYYVP